MEQKRDGKKAIRRDKIVPEDNLKEVLYNFFNSATLLTCFNRDNFPIYSNILASKFLQEVLKDKETLTTMNILFDNSLNVCKAAKSAFMHRNTLLYRLDKIALKIGLDLRKFEDAVIFHNITIVSELLNTL